MLFCTPPGDPSSALLEVLDPAQNSAFVDHYVNTPFDLSACLFIATANGTAGIPAPLLDRMELLQLPGYARASLAMTTGTFSSTSTYSLASPLLVSHSLLLYLLQTKPNQTTRYTSQEKGQIARRYLLPKQLAAHGIGEDQLRVTDGALQALMRGWTREAGVRTLERTVGAVCRHTAVKVVEWNAAHAPPAAVADADAAAAAVAGGGGGGGGEAGEEEGEVGEAIEAGEQQQQQPTIVYVADDEGVPEPIELFPDSDGGSADPTEARAAAAAAAADEAEAAKANAEAAAGGAAAAKKKKKETASAKRKRLRKAQRASHAAARPKAAALAEPTSPFPRIDLGAEEQLAEVLGPAVFEMDPVRSTHSLLTY